jgi:hypothetical protein
VPAATPVTIPVLLPMAATDGLLLVHTPPLTLLVRPVVLPAQTDAEEGVMVAGVTLTVIVFTAAQPNALV